MTLFLLLGCLFQLRCESICLVLLYLVLLSPADLLFSYERMSGSGSRGEGRWWGAGRKGGRETVGRISCMREESIFFPFGELVFTFLLGGNKVGSSSISRIICRFFSLSRYGN